MADAVKEQKEKKEVKKSTVLEPGQKVKTVKESTAYDKTETVPGIREGKVGAFGK